MLTHQSTAHAQPNDSRARWTRALLCVTGVVLIILFVHRVGSRAVLTQLLRVGPKVLWLLVPYAIGTALAAFPFAWLMPRELRPRARSLIAGRFAASSANALLPFFGIAGEPSRLLWLEPQARPWGVAAMVFDRLLYNCANSLLLLAGAIAALWTAKLPYAFGFAAVGFSALMLLVTMVGFWLVARFGIGRRLHALLHRMLGAAYAGEHFVDCVDAALLSLVRGKKQPLLATVACHWVARCCIATEVFVGLWVLGVKTSFANGLILAVVPIALSVLFSSIPSQLGVQEGAQVFVASALGLGPTVGLTLALLQRIRQLTFALSFPWLVGAARPSARFVRSRDTLRARSSSPDHTSASLE